MKKVKRTRKAIGGNTFVAGFEPIPYKWNPLGYYMPVRLIFGDYKNSKAIPAVDKNGNFIYVDIDGMDYVKIR